MNVYSGSYQVLDDKPPNIVIYTTFPGFNHQ